MPKSSSFADLGDFDVITSRPANGMEVHLYEVAPSKHETTYQTLKRLIASGELRDERDFRLQPLANRCEISRNTLTRAFNRLVAEELVRYTRQKGYGLWMPTASQLEHRFVSSRDQVCSALILDQGEKRQRQYGLDREEKLALAELLPEMAPPLAVAAEFEDLLRTAVARSGDPARRTAFEAELTRLMLARRVEHLVVSDHREEVAQLMRSFYRGQYDRFVRALDVYTAKRIRAAASIASEIQRWAQSGDEA
jgi:DNA-binding transcriptional regulator YhcF (GntR family)